MNRRIAVLAALVAALVAAGLAGAAWAADTPLDTRTVKVADPARRPGMDRTVICTRFRDFVVREIRLGDDIGSESVSVLPASRKGCAAGDGAGRLDGHDGMSFVAAWGRYLLLSWPDGFSGTAPIAVYDATTRRKLLAERATYEPAQTARSEADGSLVLSYRRAVVAPCSLAQDGPACWARLQREAPFLAARPAPLAACAAAYAAQGLKGKDLENPSILAFPVQERLTVAGARTLLAAGEGACWPAE